LSILAEPTWQCSFADGPFYKGGFLLITLLIHFLELDINIDDARRNPHAKVASWRGGFSFGRWTTVDQLEPLLFQRCGKGLIPLVDHGKLLLPIALVLYFGGFRFLSGLFWLECEL